LVLFFCAHFSRTLLPRTSVQQRSNMCFFLHSSKNTGVGVGVGTLIVLSSPTRFQCTYAIHEPSPFERPAFFNGIIAFYSVPNPSQPHPNPSSRKTGPVFAPGSKARQARPETPRPFSRHRCRFCLWNSLRRRRRSRGCRCLPGKGRRDGGGRGGGEKVSWGSVLSHAPCVCLGPREREIGRQAESRQGLSASPPEKDPARVCVDQCLLTAFMCALSILARGLWSFGQSCDGSSSSSSSSRLPSIRGVMSRHLWRLRHLRRLRTGVGQPLIHCPSGSRIHAHNSSERGPVVIFLDVRACWLAAHPCLPLRAGLGEDGDEMVTRPETRDSNHEEQMDQTKLIGRHALLCFHRLPWSCRDPGNKRRRKRPRWGQPQPGGGDVHPVPVCGAGGQRAAHREEAVRGRGPGAPYAAAGHG